jgi:putative flippase GtrA
MTIVRYLFVQVVAYAIDMGVFLAALYLGHAGALVANVLGKIAAGLFAYVTHQAFTFRVPEEGRGAHQAARYFLLLGINIPLSSGVLALLLLVIDQAAIAKFVSDVICVGLTFWISKKWVFVARGGNDAANTGDRKADGKDGGRT